MNSAEVLLHIYRKTINYIVYYISVVIPVWLVSHLQLLTPAAAFPLLCCGNRLVHQTASPPRASADPSEAGAGSVRKSQNFSFSEVEETRKQQTQWCLS